jgi:hypothetical protein
MLIVAHRAKLYSYFTELESLQEPAIELYSESVKSSPHAFIGSSVVPVPNYVHIYGRVEVSSTLS